MKRTLTRRRAVSILAATAAAGLGRLNGLVPELSLLTPQTLGSPAADAKWRVRELSGDELRARVNAAAAHRNGAAAMAAVARRGLVMRPADASAIALSWDDGQPVGDLVRIPVFDPRTGRQGSLVHVNAGEKVVSGFSLQSAGDGARDIYKVSDGIASRSSTMRPTADGGKVIAWADGHQTVLPPLPGGGGRDHLLQRVRLLVPGDLRSGVYGRVVLLLRRWMPRLPAVRVPLRGRHDPRVRLLGGAVLPDVVQHRLLLGGRA